MTGIPSLCILLDQQAIIKFFMVHGPCLTILEVGTRTCLLRVVLNTGQFPAQAVGGPADFQDQVINLGKSFFAAHVFKLPAQTG